MITFSALLQALAVPVPPPLVELHDQTGLYKLVHSLVEQGVAGSTLRAYASGKWRYLDFCQ